MRLSPSHAGLTGLCRSRLQDISRVPNRLWSCGPIRLSPSGKLGDPEVCASVPPSSVRRIRLSVMWRTLQAMQLSPHHAGLAGLQIQHLLSASRFAAMLLSPSLSASGEAAGL